MYTKWLPFINKNKIILASTSPHRKILLENLGLKFDVIPSNFPENLEKGDPIEYVKLTSEKKFESFMSDNCDLDFNILISADTIIEYEGLILEKPSCKEDIYNWFHKYSNNKVSCYTSVSYGFIRKNHISKKNECFKYNQFTTKTDIFFVELNDELINDYVQTEEHYGKAGGFGIQGLAKSFIKKIDGCYENVIGFPSGEFIRNFITSFVELYGKEAWNFNN